MDLHDYAACDGVGLATLVRTRAVSAAEVEDSARRAIGEVDQALGATVGELLEPALGAGGEGGVFTGVPFALKEVAPHLKGQVTQLGSRWAGDGVTGVADTHFGQRVRAAGLRVVARTGRPSSRSTRRRSRSHTGQPVIRGISSAASAARAAARPRWSRRGRCRSPTRRTAAARSASRLRSAGSSGLKPTRSRIPVGPGLWEGLHGMAHDFVLCRTLRDAAAALDALHGPGRVTST